MAKSDKKKVTYTKDMMVKNVAVECKRDKKTVREIYNAIEDLVFSTLSSANADNDVSVRLFEGVVLDGVYVPAHEKVNNLTGEMIITKEKISPKARITRSYCDKVNA